MNDGEEDDNACNGPLSTRDSSALYAADEGVTPLASQQIWNAAVHINRDVVRVRTRLRILFTPSTYNISLSLDEEEDACRPL